MGLPSVTDKPEPLASTPETRSTDVLRDVLNRPNAQLKQRHDMGEAQSTSLQLEGQGGRRLFDFAFR